ncbi:MAG: SpoIVB peptidase [Clostridiales bacterium]|nr:SpoIVB peptidase [Clostridiales bacterium]
MKIKNLRHIFIIGLLIFAFIVCLNIPFFQLFEFSGEITLTYSELEEIKKNNFFGPFIKVSLLDSKIIETVNNSYKNDNVGSQEIQFKLFDLIPIKTQKIKIISDDKVLVGGNAIGLVLKTDGVLVVGSSSVTTLNGERDILKENLLEIGDVLTQIENETVENVSSISSIINKKENAGRELIVKGIRKNKEFITKIKPCYDVKSGDYKLGVWVRDDASGVGTLTYVNSNNRFGALGHPICDSETKSIINLKEGKVYKCSVLGVNKGVTGNPGELRGLFMQGKNEQGIIEKNNNYGIYGSLNNESEIFKSLTEMPIGSRVFVKPGKAQIKCCVDGERVESFDVEIIKTNYQNYSNDKSMVIRVTDERLISKTGGIVQGMSGSPIIQNGKIVGAVTHVFVNDPTKGFGVYIDWMLKQ